MFRQRAVAARTRILASKQAQSDRDGVTLQCVLDAVRKAGEHSSGIGSVNYSPGVMTNTMYYLAVGGLTVSLSKPHDNCPDIRQVSFSFPMVWWVNARRMRVLRPSRLICLKTAT